MHVLRFAVLALGAASVVYACSSSSSSGASHDGGTTGDVGVPPAPEGGGYCCPPDPAPSCDMYYGGYSATATCEQTQDGMPEPNDPSWVLTTDSHGCKVWTSSLSATSTICGAGPSDATTPQDSGTSADTGVDTGASDSGSNDGAAE